MDNNRINSNFSMGQSYYFNYSFPQDKMHSSLPADTFTASTGSSQPKTTFDLSKASQFLFREQSTVELVPASTFQPMITVKGERMVATLPRFTANGDITMGCGNTIFIFNPGDGTQKKKVEMPGDVLSVATSDNGAIFACVGKNDGKLMAITDPDKPPTWTFSDNGCTFHNVVTGPDKNTLIALGSNKKMYALDSATGEKKWEYQLGDVSAGLPTFSADGSTIYTGTWNGEINAVNCSNGEKVWSAATNGSISSSPALDKNGNVIINSWNGKIRSFDGKTGKLNWENALDSGSGRTPAVGLDGTIFTSSEHGVVYAFNPADGTKKWEKPTGMEFSSAYLGISMLPDGSLLLSGSSDLDSKFMVLNPLTGNKQVEYTDNNFLALPPTFNDDGTMAVTSTEGKTLVFKFEMSQPEDVSTITVSSGNYGVTTDGKQEITYSDSYVSIDGAILHFRNPVRWRQSNNPPPMY